MFRVGGYEGGDVGEEPVGVGTKSKASVSACIASMKQLGHGSRVGMPWMQNILGLP